MLLALALASCDAVRIVFEARPSASALSRSFLVATALWSVAMSPTRADTIRISIDATELPRKLLSSSITLPIPDEARSEGGAVALWYPKWVPGVHAPGGPVQNVAGFVVRNSSGDVLDWKREPGEVYRINVAAGGASELEVEVRYIANQPSTNSNGIDAFGSEEIGFISANTVLVVPQGLSTTETTVEPSVTLPEDWTVATALRARAGVGGQAPAAGSANTITFEPVSLETFVDSPVLCGRHTKTYDLVEEPVSDRSPPQTLHVVSESKSVLLIDETLLSRYRRLTTEATLLFESHPFDRYDLLLALSDVMPRNGLEHLTSSFNVVNQRALDDEKSLKGWERYLVPHEYVHAWCGKYRRPAGMLTPDYHTPKATELLWVYEGLTQYLGKVLEVRSGLATPDDLAWYARTQVRSALYSQGRDWRPLDDTAAAAWVLRRWSQSWGNLRRGQDFYHEGAMIWLEADARIRNLTDGARSLDDFCRVFFARKDGDPIPKPHSRGDVIETLNGVAADDWDTFIHARIEEPGEAFGLELLAEIGYRVQYDNEYPEPPDLVDPPEGIDALESIGMTVSSEGSVGTVVLGSPADEARLAPGMEIRGVDGHVWSRNRMADAIEESARTREMELLVESGDKLVTRVLAYDGGPRHLVLVRDEEKPDRLAEIAKPLDERPLPGRGED